MLARLFLVSTVSALAIPAMAIARDQATELDEIIVTGQTRGYVAINSVTATKTDTPLLDTKTPAGQVATGTADRLHSQLRRLAEDA